MNSDHLYSAASFGNGAAGARLSARLALPVAMLILGLSPLSAPAQGGAAATVELTDSDRAWLAAHPVVRVGFPLGLPPLTFADADGNPQGLLVDYLQTLSKRVGIEYTPVMATWPELIAMAKAREIDVFPAIETADRRQYAAFTDKIVELPYGIITRTDARNVHGMGWLQGKTVAVIENAVIHKYLQQDEAGRELHIILVSTLDEGLQTVIAGKADAYASEIVTVSHVLKQEKYAGLKIAAPTDYPSDLLKFAVRNDWPELVSLFNRSMASMTPDEHRAIGRQWLPDGYDGGPEQGTSWGWIIAVAAVVIIIIVLGAVLMIWIRRSRQGIS